MGPMFYLVQCEEARCLISAVVLGNCAPGFWLVRAGRPLLHLSGSVFAYTYKMLASAALQRRILATSWHRCTG